MRKLDPRLICGLLLIAGGVFYLLQNLGLIHWSGLVWGIAAGVLGVLLAVWFAMDRWQWWAIIPSLVLLAVAALAVLDSLAPAFFSQWGGTIFLGAIGLSFWIIYLLDRDRWWAIIPGGVLITLGAVAGLERGTDIQTGGIFFLGLGATFLLVAFAPTPHGQMRWAFIPAAVLGILGLLLFVGFQSIINYLWPVALIVGGLLLMLRAFRRRA